MSSVGGVGLVGLVGVVGLVGLVGEGEFPAVKVRKKGGSLFFLQI